MARIVHDNSDLATPPPAKWSVSVLYQAEYWQNIRGERVPIASIDARYARNIINMLLRQQQRIEVAMDWLSCMADDGWGGGFWPDADLMTTELVVALRGRLDPDDELYLEPPPDLSWQDDYRAAVEAWYNPSLVNISAEYSRMTAEYTSDRDLRDLGMNLRYLNDEHDSGEPW